ncbi:hypothetical protein L7F22_060439 [Adiantum nelumboides]|nr:hypothetical protein [Adiantum nelumboides]
MRSRGGEEQGGPCRRKYRRPLLSAAAHQLPQQVHTVSSIHNKNRAEVARDQKQPLVRSRLPISAFFGGLAVAAAKFATVLASKVFCAKSWPFLQTASLSTFFIRKHYSDFKLRTLESAYLADEIVHLALTSLPAGNMACGKRCFTKFIFLTQKSVMYEEWKLYGKGQVNPLIHEHPDAFMVDVESISIKDAMVYDDVVSIDGLFDELLADANSPMKLDIKHEVFMQEDKEDMFLENYDVMTYDAYRTLRFWRRLLPIYTRYITTKWQVRNKSYAEKDKVWAQTHEWGSKKVYELILDMSGFYVKSAQILASKAEFVPGAWTRHLSKLLDSAPPRPFHEVSRTIRQQLKESSWGASMQKHKIAPPLEAAFSDLEKAPLATASIAQVHGGTLRDGTRIVVKVQHRGMETMMRSDLRNIVWLAKFLQGQLPVDLYPIVKEIQNTIPLEFNFEREVRFMGAIKGSMEVNQVKQIVCPSSHTEYCTKKLIVMERIDGVPFTQIIHPSKGDVHPRLGEALQAVRHLLEAYGQMIFLDGVFHADPHAGNLFLLPDGRLGLLDYGQSKEIDRGMRRKLSRMVLALCDGNSFSIALALLDIGVVFEPADAVNVPLDRVATAARILFDVCYVEEATVSPMAQNSILTEIPLKKFNQEVWMVIRTNLLLRGLCFSLKLNISAAKIWRPYAMTAIQGS